MTLPVQRTVLFSNAGSGNSNAADWNGGRGVFSVYGSFGGATVSLQWSPDDGTTWFSADRTGDTYTTFTANGVGGFELPPGKIRASISGGSSVSVTAVVGGSNR